MKNGFKRVVAFACALAVMISMATVCSASTDEKLYEKYSYDENFEYEDEIIGHALKATVPRVMLYYSAELTYSPVIFDANAFEAIFQEMCAQLGSEYSQEEIAVALLQDLQENVTNYLSYGSPRTVSADLNGWGSGVVLSEDGYIATNAHVVSVDEQTKLQMCNGALGEKMYDDLMDILRGVSEYGVEFDDAQLEDLYYTILSEVGEKAKISDENIEVEVWFPPADGDTSEDAAVKYEAQIIEVGTATGDGNDGFTQDTAIIKIDAENLVALKLSDSLPESNSKIVSAGYPSASDAIFQMAGSQESGMSVTIGTGQVARPVSIKGSNYKALQVTTTISGGNSGGPSVDARLDIEGLNTYNLIADARYAYMVSAEFVNDIAKGCELGQSEASKTFLLGLQMLQQDYGLTAVECFERVRELQPDTPYIDTIIKLAEKAPANEAPIGSVKNGGGMDMTLIIIIVAVAVVLVAVIVAVVVMINKKKGKGKPAAEARPVASTYTPPAAPARPTSPTYAPPAAPARPTAPVHTPTAPSAYTPPAAPAESSKLKFSPTTRSTTPAPTSHSAFKRTAELDMDTPVRPAPAAPAEPATPEGGSGLKMSSNFKKRDDLD